MENSLKLGCILGIEVGINWTWLFIFALVTFSLATGLFPNTVEGLSVATYWIMGAVAAVLLFVAVLLHELAHSLAARAQGMPVDRIVLFIFGGISNIQEQPPSPRIEFIMTIVGPLTSIALGALALGARAGLDAQNSILGAILLYLGAVNLLLGFFNLIPGFPLDGGRNPRSIIWAASDNRNSATRIASIAGLVVAWLMIFGGIALALLTADLLGGLWIAFVGWFLMQAAGSRYQHATQRAGEPG